MGNSIVCGGGASEDELKYSVDFENKFNRITKHRSTAAKVES